MSYYIKYNAETGRIKGFTLKQSDDDHSYVEVGRVEWKSAQEFNTITVGDERAYSTVDYSVDTTARDEYSWAANELSSSDIQLSYHKESSSRAVATLQEWIDYREALRDYATVEDGVYSYTGDRPVMPS